MALQQCSQKYHVDLHECRKNLARLQHALKHTEGQRRQDLLQCLYGWQMQYNRLVTGDRPERPFE